MRLKRFMSWLTGKAATVSSLHEIIRPEARLRWTSPLVSSYTPDTISQIIRGAMSGDLRPQWQLFDLMEQSWPRLQKNLGELKDAVTSLSWSIQPWAKKGQVPSATAQRKADLVDELIWSMRPKIDLDENDFEDTLRDLMDARGKGLSLLEVYWEQTQSAFGQVWTPRATRYVTPTYYGYPMSGVDRLMLRAGEITRQDGSLLNASNEWIELPEHKFILGICKTKSGHPISGAMLRALGFWWAAANFTGEWLLNYCQLFGQPIRWATYDPSISREDKAILEDMLTNMGSAAWGMLPAGTQLELKESVKGGTDNPQIALLDLADKVCDILVLRQTLTTDVQDSGSLALGNVHQNVLSGVKASLADWVGKVITNQLIRSIVMLNFGDETEIPRLMPSDEMKVDPKLEAERLCMLLDRGVPMSKEWFYEQVSIPMPAKDDDVLETRRSQMPAVDPGNQAQTPEDGAEDKKPEDAQVDAKAAGEEAVAPLVKQTVARVVGVRERLLAPVQAELDRLVLAAKSGRVSDEQLLEFIEDARRNLPDLFADLEINALSDALEDAMGKAVVRGLRDAVQRS